MAPDPVCWPREARCPSPASRFRSWRSTPRPAGPGSSSRSPPAGRTRASPHSESPATIPGSGWHWSCTAVICTSGNQGEPGIATTARRVSTGSRTGSTPSPGSVATGVASPLTGTDFSACTSSPPELRALLFRASPARRHAGARDDDGRHAAHHQRADRRPCGCVWRPAPPARRSTPAPGSCAQVRRSAAIDWLTTPHVLAPGQSVDVTVQAAAAPVLASHRLRASLEVLAVDGKPVPHGCEVATTGPVTPLTPHAVLLERIRPRSQRVSVPQKSAAGVGRRGKSFRGWGWPRTIADHAGRHPDPRPRLRPRCGHVQRRRASSLPSCRRRARARC